MALVTLQLSSVGAQPSPVQEDEKSRRKRIQRRQSFVMVKGAALLLQDEDDQEENKEPPLTTGSTEQQLHLQAMLQLLLKEDTLKLAVRLEPVRSCLTRYLLIVSSVGKNNEEQTILLGVDFSHDGSDHCTIGTVLPVWSNTQVFLDGDGGFSVTRGKDVRAFKPISVQTMWSLLQMLHKACEAAETNNYILSDHPGVAFYQEHHRSPQGCINAWMLTADITSTLRDATTPEREETERIIRRKLQDILRESDLENITSKQENPVQLKNSSMDYFQKDEPTTTRKLCATKELIEGLLPENCAHVNKPGTPRKPEVRTALEQHTNCALQDYTEFIDNEMIMILAQMDRPSEIFPYLYLGSEWNASNLEELQKNRVTHILNVTREIDNFFPETFTYLNIRVLDEESTNLLQYWKETHNFISSARLQGTNVFVHCKMGVSRSASTVIAYAMKEYEWTLEEALKYVKERRSIVQPNSGFLRQLQTYQGILGASKQRHSYLWDPRSAPQISRYPSPPDSLSNLPSAPTQRKMNLRALMRSISEMEVTDTAAELKDKPTKGEKDVSQGGNCQSENLDTISEQRDSLIEQLDSLSSMDDSFVEEKDSSMDQDDNFEKSHPDVPESSPQMNTRCTSMNKESTSLDEVFSSPSQSPHPPPRSRRKKKLVAQQSVESTRAGHTVKSQSVADLEGAGLVSKRLQEAEQGRKARITRQSNVGESPEEL